MSCSHTQKEVEHKEGEEEEGPESCPGTWWGCGWAAPGPLWPEQPVPTAASRGQHQRLTQEEAPQDPAGARGSHREGTSWRRVRGPLGAPPDGPPFSQLPHVVAPRTEEPAGHHVPSSMPGEVLLQERLLFSCSLPSTTGHPGLTPAVGSTSLCTPSPRCFQSPGSRRPHRHRHAEPGLWSRTGAGKDGTAGRKGQGEGALRGSGQERPPRLPWVCVPGSRLVCVSRDLNELSH